MELIKHTLSVCPYPQCKKEIPAVIIINNTGVIMQKTCPEHGHTEALIERDPIFYMFVDSLGSNIVYPGSFLALTERCNTRCKYCYMTSSPIDITKKEIMEICQALKPPFYLIGGEPTVREDLFDIMAAIHDIGPTYLITNGIKLADPVYLEALLNTLTATDGCAELNISLNPKENNLCGEYPTKIQAIENLAHRGIKFDISFAIDDLSQIDEVINVLDKYRHYIRYCRIRLVSNAGYTQNVVNQIFVSEAYDYLKEKSVQEKKEYAVETRVFGNKSNFFNVRYDGHHIIFVRLYDKYNLDIIEQDCEPISLFDGVVSGTNYALVRGCSL